MFSQMSPVERAALGEALRLALEYDAQTGQYPTYAPVWRKAYVELFRREYEEGD